MRYRYRIEPTPAQRRCWRGCSGVAGWCSTTHCGSAARPIGPGIKLSDSEIQRRVITAGQDDRASGLAGRGAQCGVGAVGQRLPARLAQLLRLGHRETQGPQGGSAADEIPQGSSAVVSAHPQRIPCPAQRPVVCGQGRRGPGALVARAAQRTVVGHDHPRTRWPLLRQFRRRRRRDTAAGGGAGGRGGCGDRPVGDDRHHRRLRLDVANPKHLGRKLRKLRRLEREKSRRQKGSNNRDKTRRKVAIAHSEVARARRDYHHKQALALVRENK